MGFTPQQINEMSLWQFQSAFDGYVAANTADDGSLTAKEQDELWEYIQAP